MCLNCLRHVPDTIELNGASTVWDMSQACLKHLWKPGAVNRQGGCVDIKIAIQQTASHCNWLQGGAIKMEGERRIGTLQYTYSCMGHLEVQKYFSVPVEQILHLFCKLFLSRRRMAYPGH